MKRLLAGIMIAFMLLSMFGCEIVPNNNDDNGTEGDASSDNGEENTGGSENQEETNDWHHSEPWNGGNTLVFDSYEALVAAWEIIVQNNEETKRSYYILPDHVGDDYSVIHVLHIDTACADLSKQLPAFSLVRLYLHGSSTEMCGHTPYCGEYYMHGIKLFLQDPNDEKYAYIEDLISVDILTINYVDIEDRSLLRTERTNSFLLEGKYYNIYLFNQPFEYDIFYGDTRIVRLKSCIELDDEVINLILNNLCGLYDLQ